VEAHCIPCAGIFREGGGRRGLTDLEGGVPAVRWLSCLVAALAAILPKAALCGDLSGVARVLDPIRLTWETRRSG
jgi:hypothetical protein